MSDELIRKSGLINTLNGWLSGEPSETLFGTGYDGAVRDIIKLIESEKTVNAVELPCEIGDILFEVCVVCEGIHKREVHGFNIRENGMFIVCDTTNFEKREIGKQVFLSRGEAEEALVLRQCFQQTMTEENENASGK